MILIKADGTVVPLGLEGVVESAPVNPNWARKIQAEVRRKLEESHERELEAGTTQGQLWSKLGHQVVGAEMPIQ